MVIYLYADVYFAVNFIMNWSLLWLSGRLLGLKPPVWRGLAAASAGAAYALLLLVPNSRVFLSPIAKVLFSLFMIAVAFGPRSVRQLLRQSAYFFMVALATAGAFLAMEALAPRGSGNGGSPEILEGMRRSAQAASWMFLVDATKSTAGTAAYAGVPWWFLLAAVAMAGSTLGIVWLESRLSVRAVTPREVYDARITLGDCVVAARLLLDTGNRLKDPYTGAPVVIVDPSVFAGILPDCLLGAVKDRISAKVRANSGSTNTALQDIDRLTSDHPWIINRMRLIPFTGVSGDRGMLTGLRADLLEIKTQGRLIKTDRAVIALSPLIHGKDCSFDGLLHPEIFSALTDQRSCVERRDST